MSWVSSLAPWQWGVLATVPVGIVLLYFLKLRREAVEVPSTYLWLRTIEDLHVNSLMQRLRRSLLLFLQLLAVALAAIALLRPGIRGETSGQGRMVFLLDSSASMQATDVDEDASRFEQARRLIGDRLDTMEDTDTAMLVTFSDRAEVLQSFTSDRRRLREALARATVTNRPTNVLSALRAADGLANPRRSSQVGDVNDVQVADAMPADLLLYSDGGFQTVTEFSLGNLIPQYVAVGSEEASNTAITAFSAERNSEQPGEVQAFATVIHHGTNPIEANASLFLGDELIDASAVALEPNEQTGFSFTLHSEEAVSLRLMLEVDDDLELDNVAFAGLTPMRTVSVLVVTPGNTPLELGLTTEKAGKICDSQFVTPSYLETDEYQKRADSAIDDLIIFDRCSPKAMPPTNTFFIGSLPSSGWKWSSEPGQLVLIDIDRTHPIMRYLELFSLLIFSGRAIEGPPGTTELAAADIGSILAIAPRDSFQDLVLGFEIISSTDDGSTQTNTNWYAERSWPVFVLNVLRHLAGAAEASTAPSHRPGDTVRLRLEASIDRVDVHRLGDVSGQVAAGPSGITEIVDTEQPGNYQVQHDGRLVDLFAINLFDSQESNLSVAPVVELGYEAIQNSSGGVESRREFWRWLLLGVLGLLAMEWWVYSRRVS